MKDQLTDHEPSQSTKSTIRRRVAFAITAICLSLIVSVILLEIVLRIFNPVGARETATWHFFMRDGIRPSTNEELVWENIPGWQSSLPACSVRINELGFRGEEIELTRNPDTLRIYMLGDSMTLGLNIEEEDTAAAQIRGLLSDKNIWRSVEVINGGVIGYTTLQEEAQLKNYFPQLNPDIVTLWWFFNDTELTGKENPKTHDEELKSLIGLNDVSLKRKIVDAVYKVFPCTMAFLRYVSAERGMNGSDQVSNNTDPTAHPEGFRKNLDSLRRIAKYLNERSTPFIVYSYSYYKELDNVCGEVGVPYVFSTDTPRVVFEAKYAVSAVDGHFNHEGNRVVAESLTAAIMEQLDSKSND